MYDNRNNITHYIHLVCLVCLLTYNSLFSFPSLLVCLTTWIIFISPFVCQDFFVSPFPGPDSHAAGPKAHKESGAPFPDLYYHGETFCVYSIFIVTIMFELACYQRGIWLWNLHEKSRRSMDWWLFFCFTISRSYWIWFQQCLLPFVHHFLSLSNPLLISFSLFSLFLFFLFHSFFSLYPFSFEARAIRGIQYCLHHLFSFFLIISIFIIREVAGVRTSTLPSPTTSASYFAVRRTTLRRRGSK